MSASKNKSRSSSGLRMIWIPGRKKHSHKGHYDTTSKQINYSGRHKPNQPWSLGGNKGLEKLVESDIPGSSEGASRIIGVLPAVAAGASTTAMKLDDENQFALLGEKEEKVYGNGSDFLKSNNINTEKHTRDDDPLSQDNSQNSQQQKSERDSNSPEKKNNNHKKSKDDINSIESLQNKKLKDSSLDITDSSLYLHKYNGKKKNKKKKKKNKDECSNESEDDPDAKIVKCLYYTLMCCECTIS